MRLRRAITALAGAACIALAAAAVTAGPAAAAAGGATRPLDSLPTRTSLTVTPDSSVYGQENGVQMRVQVTGGTGHPSGSFSVRSAQGILCGGTVTSGSGTCSPSAQQLPPGNYQLTATYLGSGANSQSSSPFEPFSVSPPPPPPAPTTTTLTLPDNGYAYGSAGEDDINIQVTAPGGPPSGGAYEVQFDGSDVCGGTLLAGGTDRCRLGTENVLPGIHQVTAHYFGEPGFSSSDAIPQTLTVRNPSSTTTLTVPLPEVTFGQEDTEQLTATVQSSLTQTLSGPVAITAVDGNGSSTLICRQFVRVDGTIACPLGASLLPTGDYQLTATYTGDAGHDGSVSDPQPLTVTKPGATTQTSLTLSASSLAYGSEQAGTFTASVSGIGGPPTGQVTIQAGPTSVCTITLVNGSGACAPPASQLGLGSYQLTATYTGDATFASSASDPQALTVTG